MSLINKRKKKATINRRKFLRNSINAFTPLVMVGFITAGCNSGMDSSSKEDPNHLNVTSCDDLSKVSEGESNKRQSLGYNVKAAMSDKICGNCNLYIPPVKGQTCGGCILFQGPVFQDASCTYWVPQT